MKQNSNKYTQIISAIIILLLSIFTILGISISTAKKEEEVLISKDLNTQQGKTCMNYNNLGIDKDLDLEYSDNKSKTKENILELYNNHEDLIRYKIMNEIFIDVIAEDMILEANGKEYRMLNIAKERNGIFIEFMSTWCPCCIDAINNLNELSEISDKDVVSIGVETNEEELKNFSQKYKTKQEYYILKNVNVIESYGVQFVPIIFYINGDGVIEGVFNANTPAADISKALML